jgi:hypothetical protein
MCPNHCTANVARESSPEAFLRASALSVPAGAGQGTFAGLAANLLQGLIAGLSYTVGWGAPSCC